MDFQRNNHVIYYIVSILMIFCFCLYFFISTGQLKRQYKWSDEETDKNWSGKAGIQQKIADKCRNLNKSFGKKNSEHFKNILHVI